VEEMTGWRKFCLIAELDQHFLTFILYGYIVSYSGHVISKEDDPFANCKMQRSSASPSGYMV
jgi:hypothetical protein